MKTRLLWVLFLVCFPAGIVAGFFAWQGSRQAEVVVEWSTASELDTLGFNLYRSDTSDGSYTKINTALIPGSTDPLTGGSYSYVDDQVQPGITYYYELEDVGASGGSNRFGPIEVIARGGGKIELVLTAALWVIGIAGVLMLRSQPREVTGD